MRVFVAGGSGVIGRRLVPMLVAAGHDVVATTRTSAKLDELRALGAEAVIMNGLDATAVGEAVARAKPDAIIHQMTALAGADIRHFDRAFATTNALRREGTDNLLAAAAAAGVRRFIAQSYTSWTTGRSGGPVKTEEDPLDPDPPAALAQTLAAVKYMERAVQAAPLEGIILRYGNFYGPGVSEELAVFVRKRQLPIIGDGRGIWSFIHIDDAAAATVAALTAGAPGVYNIVDDEPAPVAEWLPYLARVVGAKPPRRVPVWLARLLAGEAAVALMTRGCGSSNAKAKRELGWRPRWASWREGFQHSFADGRGTKQTESVRTRAGATRDGRTG
jgi:nucleoside-diphosphate-sugar epimerase